MPSTIQTTARDITLPNGKTVAVAPLSDTATIKGKKKDDDKWWLLLLLIGLVDIHKANLFWKLYAPRSFAGLLDHTNGFGFDPIAQQYTKKGQLIDDDEVRAIFLAFLTKATADVQKQAGRMARGRIPLDQWQETQAELVKSLYIAADAAGRGGIDKVKPVESASPQPIVDVPPSDLVGALNDAVVRLKRLGDVIVAGDESSVSALIRRAGLYTGPANGVYELARRESHRDAVDETGKVILWEELNVLGNADHCRSTDHTTGCIECTKAGWVPLGTLPLPGHRTCGPSCKCYTAVRVAEPNQLSDVNESHFAPGTKNPMKLSAARQITLPNGRVVEVLALSAGQMDLFGGFNPSEPRDENGKWTTGEKSGVIPGIHSATDDSGDKTQTAVQRKKPIGTISFDTPIAGPSGAKLHNYQWQWKHESDVNHEGDEITRRVSDWDEAATNFDTGRNIVHQFGVQLPSGEHQTVSLESAAKILGFSDSKSLPATGKSAISAVKTLAKQQMQLAAAKAAHEELVAKVQARNQFKADLQAKGLPQVDTDISETGRIKYRMGDSTVSRSMRHNETENMARNDKERLDTLKDEYLADQAAKAGHGRYVDIEHGSAAAKVKDIESRIARQQAKLKNTGENEVAKLTKSVVGTTPTSQKRAYHNEVAPNGDTYHGGAFIATTDLPKKMKGDLEIAAKRGDQIDYRGTRAIPSAGKIPILPLGSGVYFNWDRSNPDKITGVNNPSGGYAALPPDRLSALKEIAEKFNAGERYVDIKDYPQFASVKDAARMYVAGMDIPESVLSRLKLNDMGDRLRKFQEARKLKGSLAMSSRQINLASGRVVDVLALDMGNKGDEGHFVTIDHHVVFITEKSGFVPHSLKADAGESKRFSKAAIERQLIAHHEEYGGSTSSQDDKELEEHAGSGGAFVFRGVKGKLPEEIANSIGKNSALRGLIRLAKPGESAGGEDALGAMGHEKYLATAERFAEGKLTAAKRHASVSPDPEINFLNAIHSNLPAKKDRGKTETINAKKLEVGNQFSIHGHTFRVVVDAGGHRVLQAGHDYPDTPVDALRTLPIDEKSFKKGRKPKVEIPFGSNRVVELVNGKRIEILALSQGHLFGGGSTGGSQGHLFAGKSDDDGVWRTVNGAHVMIRDGKITKGPHALEGKTVAEAKATPRGEGKSTESPKPSVQAAVEAAKKPALSDIQSHLESHSGVKPGLFGQPIVDAIGSKTDSMFGDNKPAQTEKHVGSANANDPKHTPMLPGVAKQPHEMIAAEYADSQMRGYGENAPLHVQQFHQSQHKAFVRQALGNGKHVSSRVLADYPDLQRSGVSKALALSSHLSSCPKCGSYDISRVPNIVGGRSLDKCKRCSHKWLHKPGSVTGEQMTPASTDYAFSQIA